jgi:predicted Zn finger-like uncharacterized protein
MADLITRCPHCHTAFRITPAHLRSAKGSVRCGSCLQVFNAKENLAEGSPGTPAPAAPAEKPATNAPGTNTPDKSTSQPSESRPQEQHRQEQSPKFSEQHDTDPDDILISDDMDIGDFADDGASEPDDFYTPVPPTSQTSLFERSHKDEDEEQEAVADDESWALDLLDDEDPTPITNEVVPSHIQPAPTPKWVHEQTSLNWDLDDTELNESGIDEDDATVHAPQTEPGEDWRTSDSGLHGLPETGHDRAYDDSLNAKQAAPAGKAYLDAIEPEPVEFAFRQEKPRWRRQLLWGGLTLVAGLVLLGQIAWLQYPSLNRVEPYRTVYSYACNLLGCELPPQQDLGAIRTSNLVVRSHPQVANALAVDVVLQNTARFAQRFPVLELSFSDLQGNAVAQRRFTPNDYLGGELTGENLMPSDQPIHIALEIVDPGAEAVNYHIRVVGDK